MSKVSGVTWFAVYAANPQKMRLFFPEGRVSCSNCRHLYADGLSRARCHISGFPKSARLSRQGRLSGTNTWRAKHEC
nr:hypothetical protein [uncultured Ruminococcus sp.]